MCIVFQFFVAPLLTESATARELNAVHAEHMKNVQTDARRRFQLIKSMAHRDHPFYKFGTGNLTTLRDDPAAAGLDTRQALWSFYKAHYVAPRMRLAVLGREPLDTLESWVTQCFAPIRDHPSAPVETESGRNVDNVAPPAAEAAPVTVAGTGALVTLPAIDAVYPPAFGPEQVGKLYHVVPVADIRSLELCWPVPSPSPHYRADPTRLISHLVVLLSNSVNCSVVVLLLLLLLLLLDDDDDGGGGGGDGGSGGSGDDEADIDDDGGGGSGGGDDEADIDDDDFISYCCWCQGHEAEGSILAHLKARGWALSLSAGCNYDHTNVNPSGAVMTVSVQLTPDGWTHRCDVAGVVFDYLALVRAQSPADWAALHAEKRAMSEISFHYKNVERPASYVTALARRMHTVVRASVVSLPPTV